MALTPTVQIRTGGISTGNFADEETPTGTINGSNKTFTLAHTPSPTTSLHLFSDGVRIRQGTDHDYVLSGTTLTLVAAPETNLLVDYRY